MPLRGTLDLVSTEGLSTGVLGVPVGGESLTIHTAPPRDTNAPTSTFFWTLELGALAVHDGASGRSDRVVEDGGVSALASWCGLCLGLIPVRSSFVPAFSG